MTPQAKPPFNLEPTQKLKKASSGYVVVGSSLKPHDKASEFGCMLCPISNTSRAVLLTPGAGGHCSPKGLCLCGAIHVEAIFIRRVPIRGVVFFKLGANCITTSRCFSF